MSIKSALVSELLSNASLTALVSSRIGFGPAAPGDPLPYITIQQISASHAHHMGAATGLVTARFLINCYGSTVKEATSVAEQVRQSLDGLRGTMGSIPLGGSEEYVSTCHLDNEIESYEPPTNGAESGVSVIQQDYMITWSVSVPTF